MWLQVGGWFYIKMCALNVPVWIAIINPRQKNGKKRKKILIKHVGVFSHVSSEKTSMINPQEKKGISLTSPPRSAGVISWSPAARPPPVKTTTSDFFLSRRSHSGESARRPFQNACLAAPLAVHFPIIVASLFNNPSELLVIYLPAGI